ncbi:MAG: VCBS repeat-containing protein [Anaerolineaceae bacterium]|nr:VCBS repeat-containing protein [Anaerolineaceae bacterium]
MRNGKKDLRIGIVLLLLLQGILLQLTTGQSSSHKLAAAPSNSTIVLGGARVTHSSPIAADLNGNGRKEIIVGASDGMLYVVAYNGSTWNKVWEVQTALAINTVANKVCGNQGSGKIEASPAVGDIDNDGQLEIVVATGGVPNSSNPSENRNGAVIAYELTNSAGTNWSFSVKSGWPFVMPDDMGAGVGARDPDGVCDGIRTDPTLGDIDGDGDLEIITMAFDRRIRAFHHNGSVVNGWPIQRESGDIILRGGQSSAAIGDIDNDGIDEIIIGTNSPPWNGDAFNGPFPDIYNIPDYTLATVWAINGDSTLVPGWPVITQQNIESSPALGDIDGDGELEVIVGTGLFDGYVNGHQVYAWNADGSLVSGWPRPTADKMPSSPAIADLDGNGTQDVIIGCGKAAPPFCRTLYAWNGSGNNLPGFPMNTPFAYPYPPVVADVDGDNNLEIVLTSLETDVVSVVQHNGSSSVDTSRKTNSIILNTPLVHDLDGDGSLETAIASSSGGQAAIYIFDETNSTSPDSHSLPWPMFQRDAAHTGLFLPPRLGFSANELRVYHPVGSGSVAKTFGTVQNIGGEQLDWSLNTSGTGGTVTADISSGTALMANESDAVQFSINTAAFSQNQWHNLGNITITATNNGQPVLGSPKTIPVFLYVGDITQVYLPFTIK